MKVFTFLIISISMIQSFVLFDFNNESSTDNWYVIDDGVMGGRSQGEFFIDKNGYGVFKGDVSLENNGGFSSLRYQMAERDISKYSKFILRLKGDGKSYQFRCKSNSYDRHSYVTEFKTTGDWQTVEIFFTNMYPKFRGQRLRIPNFKNDILQEIGFLIANKKEEEFTLKIDEILLQ